MMNVIFHVMPGKSWSSPAANRLAYLCIGLFGALWLAQSFVSAQQAFPSKLPNELRTPDAQKLVFQAHGSGDQIYACKAVDGKYVWTLKGPDANLLDGNGQLLGRHFAGPTWEAKDGSRVRGKAIVSVPSPDPGSVPWLRLDAIGHEGKGVMSKVISIQRLNTMGGKASATGCDIAHVGNEARVHYDADYYFYENTR